MADTGSQKMKLYFFPQYRSVRNIWLIKEMGVEDDFELIRYDSIQEYNATVEAYRRDVHPHGTIPALVVPGEGSVLESGAINMYLADRYKKLLPDPKYLKDYYDFIIYGNATLDELIEFFYELWMLKTPFSDEKVKKMTEKFDTCMDYLAKKLEDREFLCGDKFTAADTVLGFDLYCAALFNDGKLLEKHPKIREGYYARLQKRPAFQATINMT
ncbi:glutathione S-transferase GstA-like [Haliotis asinina]|uniref:glutathione S-transferase GstA-like n=1 Tax=Haliotis asinina TaxID=109174 RepID=UPI003531AD7B